MALINGRDDGRSAQYIYSDGLGGVVDLRLSAYDMSSPEESAKAWEKVKNGTYRGLEKLRATGFAVVAEILDGSSTYTTFRIDREHPWWTLGDQTDGAFPDGPFTHGSRIFVYRVSDGTFQSYSSYDRNFGYNTSNNLYGHSPKVVGKCNGGYQPVVGDIILTMRHGDSGTTPDPMYLSTATDTSVSGSFAMTDVIGSPENILQTDALKDGWQGSWIPVIPDGTSKDFPLTRESVTSDDTFTYSSDGGASWVHFDPTLDSVTNTWTNPTSAATVGILSYTAFAKQTKPSINKPVLNGEAGVSGVWNSSYHEVEYGCLLQESLVGTIGKATTAGSVGNTKSVTSLNLMSDGTIAYYSPLYLPQHSPLTLGAPDNNSRAVKALPYQISDNGQVSIGIQANELTYTDGSWNDDSTIKITTSGSDVFNDTAGVTNLSVVHELALPLGWSKNRARVSTQTDGVDL